MKRIPKINLSYNLESQDGWIRENLRHRLIDYAHVIAEILIESFWGNSILGMKETDVENELIDIRDIKESILKKLRKYLRDYPVSRSYSKLRSTKEKRDFIVDTFGLDIIFKRLDLREKILNMYKSFDFETRIGRPHEKRFKIASIWALALKREREISWSNIVRLLKWFHKYLRDTKYSDEIKTRDDIKKEARYFKERCQPILNDHIKSLIVSSGLFFQKLSRFEIPFLLQSIIFQKGGIEVNKIFKKSSFIFKTKMEFIGNKKFFSFELNELAGVDREPLIVFPNCEIFIQK